MACDITAGRLRACKDSLGGNSAFYIYKDIVDSFTVTDGEATAMDVLVLPFKFEIEGDLNTLEQEMVGTRDTGSRVNTQTLTIVLKKMDTPTNAQFNLLTASFSQALVVDRNGNFLALGVDDGMDWTVSAATGGAKGDGNIYTITGVATTSELAPVLDGATETAFLAAVQ